VATDRTGRKPIDGPVAERDQTRSLVGNVLEIGEMLDDRNVGTEQAVMYGTVESFGSWMFGQSMPAMATLASTSRSAASSLRNAASNRT